MDRFDDLREKISKTLVPSKEIEAILLLLVDELERLHKEIRQGYTKIE